SSSRRARRPHRRRRRAGQGSGPLSAAPCPGRRRPADPRGRRPRGRGRRTRPPRPAPGRGRPGPARPRPVPAPAGRAHPPGAEARLMNTQMRRMRPEDVPAVMELEPQLFGRGAWSRGILTEEATRADRYYVVLTEADHLIGYAGLATGVEATVMTLGVAPEHRRQGHASRMLTALLDRA